MIQPIQVALIRTDGGTQPRAGVTMAVVEEYVEALTDGADFPPVKVVYDGQSYWLYDGFHRVEAHRLAQAPMIDAEVAQGTVEDAKWLSFAANTAHGLRRTTADKRRAVEAALLHPRGQKASDRGIAEHVGVSHVMVASVRGELTATGRIFQLETRVGQDGKERRLPEKPAPPDAGDDLLGPDEWPGVTKSGEYDLPLGRPVLEIVAARGAFVRVYLLQVAPAGWVYHFEYYLKEYGRLGGKFNSRNCGVFVSAQAAILRALEKLLYEVLANVDALGNLTRKQAAELRDGITNELMKMGVPPHADKDDYPQPNELGDYLPWDAYDWEEFRPSDPRLADCWIRSLQVGVELYAVGWAVRIGKRAHVESASEGSLARFGEQEGARAIVLWVEDVYDSLDEAGKAAARALLRWTLAEFSQWSEQIDERDPEPAADQDPERPKLEVLPPSATQVRMVASAFRLLATSNYDWLDLIVKVRAEVGADVIEAARKNVEFCAKACRAPRVG